MTVSDTSINMHTNRIIVKTSKSETFYLGWFNCRWAFTITYSISLYSHKSKIIGITGFVHHEPKKNPGLFQNFQGPFSQFSGPKITNRQQIFIPTTCLELRMLRSVAQGK